MLELVNIAKSFSSQTALQSLNLKIQEGEFFSLLGPSGCGKTTLLRIIAGLESADQGQILLNGQRVDTLPAMERPFNMVFQRYALFPHLSVAENIAFGLKLKKVSPEEIQKEVKQVLELVGMASFGDRYPETLSGGQAQRVAIARALVNKPKVLLLDEPLSALDQKMRDHMQKELRALQQKLGLTFIYVTHDQDEAFALSDRVAIMDHGVMEYVGSPQQIFAMTDNQFVSDFIGKSSHLQGDLVEISSELLTLKLPDGSLILSYYNMPASKLKIGMRLDIYIREAVAVEVPS